MITKVKAHKRKGKSVRSHSRKVKSHNRQQTVETDAEWKERVAKQQEQARRKTVTPKPENKTFTREEMATKREEAIRKATENKKPENTTGSPTKMLQPPSMNPNRAKKKNQKGGRAIVNPNLGIIGRTAKSFIEGVKSVNNQLS
jgi:hypothetical protein